MLAANGGPRRVATSARKLAHSAEVPALHRAADAVVGFGEGRLDSLSGSMYGSLAWDALGVSYGNSTGCNMDVPFL